MPSSNSCGGSCSTTTAMFRKRRRKRRGSSSSASATSFSKCQRRTASPRPALAVEVTLRRQIRQLLRGCRQRLQILDEPIQAIILRQCLIPGSKRVEELGIASDAGKFPIMHDFLISPEKLKRPHAIDDPARGCGLRHHGEPTRRHKELM